MRFSEEERNEIDKILAEVEEEQKQNGNVLYSFEEVTKSILNRLEKEKESYRLQNLYY